MVNTKWAFERSKEANKYKYYIKIPRETTKVSFDLIGSKTDSYALAPCYSRITYKDVSEYDFIKLYFEKDKTPYSEETVCRYFNLLKELGFEFIYSSDDKVYTINIDLSNYKNKLKLNVLLIFSRYIYEQFINTIVERFLILIDDNQEGDLFNLLCKAHLDTSQTYANSNHMLFSTDTMIINATKNDLWNIINTSYISLQERSQTSYYFKHLKYK